MLRMNLIQLQEQLRKQTLYFSRVVHLLSIGRLVKILST